MGAIPMPPAMPQQPPAQAMDPHSQYLAAALSSLQKQPQQSAQGMSENLLAQAMLQQAYKNQGQNPNSGSAATTPNDGTGGLGGPINPATGQPWPTMQPQQQPQGLLGMGMAALGGG